MRPFDIDIAISKLKESIRCLKCRVKVLEDAPGGGGGDTECCADLQAQIDDINSQITSINEAIEGLGDTSALEAEIDALQNDVLNIQNSLITSTIQGRVATFADLPSAASNTGEYWFVNTSTGQTWNPLNTYRSQGIYYSDGATWTYQGSFPYEATQIQVDAGIANDVFITPLTLENAAKWNDFSLVSHTHTFSSLTSKPTTIGGYGITDFNSLGDARWSLLAHTHTFASLTSKPTTLLGYGITDAYPLSGNPSGFLTSFTELDPVWLADKPSYLTSATATSTYFPLLGGSITGTGGAGFVGLIPQSSSPSTPASGVTLYARSTGALSWKGTNGFQRSFVGTGITADRDYTLPDASGTLALTSNLSSYQPLFSLPIRGNLITDTFARAAIGSNYNTGGTATITFPSSLYMRINGGTAAYTDYFEYNQYFTGDNRWTTSTTFSPSSVASGTYVAIGTHSVNATYQSSVHAHLNLNTGQLLIYRNELITGPLATSATNITIATGDSIKLTVSRANNIVTTTVVNLTTNSTVTVSYEYDYSTTFIQPNIGRFRIYQNGDNNYTSFIASVDDIKSTIVFTGDSVEQGQYSALKYRWLDIVAGDNSYSSVGGPGDKSADLLNNVANIIALTPIYCVISIGLNDLAQSVSTATYQANLASIVASLQGAGITVILCSVTASSNDGTAYTTAAQTVATNASCTFVDLFTLTKGVAVTTLNAIYNSGDGLHLNTLGHYVVGKAIKSAAPALELINNSPKFSALRLGKVTTNIPYVVGVDYLGNSSLVPNIAGADLTIFNTIKTGSGTSGFTIGSYTTTGYGAIWPLSVTGTSTNFTLVGSSAETVLGNPTSVVLSIGGTSKMSVSSTGVNIPILTGTLTSTNTVDILSGNYNGIGGLRVGAAAGVFTRGATTRKIANIVSPNYTSAGAGVDVQIIAADNNGTDNIVSLGGSPGGFLYGATRLDFIAESGIATTGGVIRAQMKSTGLIIQPAGSTYTYSAVSAFDVNATTQGSRPFPRVTTTQRNAITAVEGLTVYDTDLDDIYVYTGAAWKTYQTQDSDLTTIAGLTATTDNFIVSVASAWASRTPAQVKTTLSLNNVENTALSTWAGTTNITTLGVLTTELQVLKTTEQMKLSYDATNYTTFTQSSAAGMSIVVASTGGTSTLTFDGSGLVCTNPIQGAYQTNSSTSASSFATAAGGSGNIFSNAQYKMFAVNTQARIGSRSSTAMSPAASTNGTTFTIGDSTYNIAATGTHPLFAQLAIKPLTVGAGAGALTASASIYVEGASTGATTNYAIWVGAGRTQLDGITVLGAPIRLKGYTVGTLPAGVEGDRAYVTDATAPTYNGVLIGGGAVKIPVFYNGAAWVSC